MRRWREIRHPMYGTTTIGPIDCLRPGMLSYLTSEKWITHIAASCVSIGDGTVVLCPADLCNDVGAAGALAIPDDDPTGLFWRAAMKLAETHAPMLYEFNRTMYIDHSARIGGRAFKLFRGELMPTLGGVSVGAGSTIGANACIDAGIYGEYTELGSGVHVDNLVHIGHSSIIGDGTSIAANSTLGGWTRIGKGCRIETNVTVFQSVTIGDGTRVGSGSVVTRDLPAGVVAYGSPARVVREIGK